MALGILGELTEYFPIYATVQQFALIQLCISGNELLYNIIQKYLLI